MTAEKETANFSEVAEKIMEWKETRENGEKSQKTQAKAKNPKKNRFLACLRRAWRTITGREKPRHSSPERTTEKLQEPNAMNITECDVDISHQGKEENVEEIQSSEASFVDQDGKERNGEEVPKPEGEDDGVERSKNSCSPPEISEPSPISIKADDGEDAQSATAPFSIDFFTFHKVLGEGAYGKVYLAKDKIRQECVAIKSMAKSVFVAEDCGSEERDVLQISHKCPQLIHGIGTFHTSDFLYFVTEPVTGGDLHDFLMANYPLEDSTIRFMTSELICGTQFLHKSRILHRDLKLENVLLREDGHIKIIDFGFCATGFKKNIKNWCGGTVGYVAPEVLNFKAHGPGADYFSIGVILYQLYTSNLPFPGEELEEYKASLQHEPRCLKYMPSDIGDLISRLLCRNPSHRLGVNEDIRTHPYFEKTNWEETESGKAEPPTALRTSSTDQSAGQPAISIHDLEEPIRDKDQHRFNQFSFVCPEWSRHYHPVITQKKPKSGRAKLMSCWPFKKRRQ